LFTKRIIPCLDVKDGTTVKGVNFLDLRQAGDPVALAARYSQQGADELVFLDISATAEGRATLRQMVADVARAVSIPFTVGGGIGSVADVAALLNAGADKVSINSAAVRRPDLITELAREFGAQCVVVAIDTKHTPQGHRVHIQGGAIATDLDTLGWARQCADRGAGEILLTSMNSDGTTQGFDLAITKALSTTLPIPVIASGGAGTTQHFVDVFQQAQADAALAASIFHFDTLPIPRLKAELRAAGLPIR